MVGVVGGGQLGRMMALAGYPLGLRFRFLDPSADCPAAQVAECITAAYDSSDAVARFADGLDTVTYEFENVPAETLAILQGRLPINPPPPALTTSQDRLIEKQFFERLGLATPKFAAVSSRADLESAVTSIGLPAILKTRRFGYDGKGQEALASAADFDSAWLRLAGHACILEERVPFDREVSILAARSESKATRFYPLARNIHRSGILRTSYCDASPNLEALQPEAETIAGRILADLDYVGILAVELFVCGGRLLVNEMAPRVHNSGHWSIEGAECSQFENHVRAVAGLPLGSTACPRPCGMVNIIGTVPDLPRLFAVPGAHVHLYGKSPRAGRKLGHVTVLADDSHTLDARMREIVALVDLGDGTG